MLTVTTPPTEPLQILPLACPAHAWLSSVEQDPHVCTSRPALQILALACLYLLSLTALTVITNVGTVDDVTSTARIFLTMPVGILDALLVVWIFMALSRTLNQLQLRGATHKLVLMKHFTNTLAVWVWVSVAWLGYELFVKVRRCTEVEFAALLFCSVLCNPDLASVQSRPGQGRSCVSRELRGWAAEGQGFIDDGGQIGS